MATTFDVIYLGLAPDIDPVEGDNFAENAGALEGQTFGSAGDPLFIHIQTLSPA